MIRGVWLTLGEPFRAIKGYISLPNADSVERYCKAFHQTEAGLEKAA
jgi:hypothetical protein